MLSKLTWVFSVTLSVFVRIHIVDRYLMLDSLAIGSSVRVEGRCENSIAEEGEASSKVKQRTFGIIERIKCGTQGADRGNVTDLPPIFGPRIMRVRPGLTAARAEFS